MRRLFNSFYRVVKGIRVFALVGESGTGKSFRAKLVTQKFGIDLLIDDGLLIRDHRILAGHSAKKEKTFLAAVKVALFDDKSHRDEVARKLQSERFESILVIGTSIKMVNKIADRLQLPQPSRIIKIEEIATQEEIEQALRSRKIEGKHVIPIPSFEAKRNYPGIFYDAIRVFLKRGSPVPILGMPRIYEKAVVRPEYSKRLRVPISESALSKMVIHCVDEFNQDFDVKRIAVKADGPGYRVVITIDVPYGTQLSDTVQALQKYVIDNIERYTGILIEEVNIIIDRVSQA
jgi:adenylate kinase family enzyme